MATYSSSRRREMPSFALSLRDCKTGARVDFTMSPRGAGGRFDTAGSVIDRAHYDARLLCSADLGAADITIEIGGEEIFLGRVVPSAALTMGHEVAYPLDLSKVDGCPFKNSYGFVGASATVCPVSGGELVRVETGAIACASIIGDLRRHVVAMLESLGGEEFSEAMRWMAVPGDDGPDSCDRASGAGGTSADVWSAEAERLLSEVEASMAALRLRPREVVREAASMLPPSKVRRVGRRETAWLQRNPSAVDAAADGRCVPRRMMALGSARSRDVPENRSVLSVLLDVSRRASALERILDAGSAELGRVLSELQALEPGGGACLPAAVIIEAQLAAATPKVKRVGTVRRRAERALRALSRVWGLEASGPFRMPNRTKTFQEVPHYARIYSAMRRWAARCEFDGAREALMLSARQAPRLYEIFCLAGMLTWLRSQGFLPDDSSDESISQVAYSLECGQFGNESRVANRYSLRRGGSKATLWYQPVFYGDEREEGGIDAHRTTSSAQPGLTPYWTPDFALRFIEGSSDRLFVIDAKFSDPSNGRDLEDAVRRKYGRDTSRRGGKRVSSVWTLFGRGRADAGSARECSEWARAQGFVGDGSLVYSALAGDIGSMLAAFGLEKSVAGESRQAAEAGDSEVTGIQSISPSLLEYAKREPDRLPAEGNNLDGKATEPEIAVDVLALVGRLAELTLEKGALRSAKNSRIQCGIEHALLKDARPKGREARYYTSVPVEAGGEKAYCYKAWRPDQVNRLRRVVEAAERRESAVEPEDALGGEVLEGVLDLVESLIRHAGNTSVRIDVDNGEGANEPAWCPLYVYDEPSEPFRGLYEVEPREVAGVKVFILADVDASRLCELRKAVAGGDLSPRARGRKARTAVLGPTVDGDGVLGRASRKRERAFDLEDILSDLVGSACGRGLLEDASACRELFGIPVPILLRKRPSGSGAELYGTNSAGPVAAQHWVYRAWTDREADAFIGVFRDKGRGASVNERLDSLLRDGLSSGEGGLANASDVDVIELIRRISQRAAARKQLESPEFCKKALGASEAVLRRKRPKGPSGRLYDREPIVVCGHRAYVLAKWTPEQKRKLASLARGEARIEAARKAARLGVSPLLYKLAEKTAREGGASVPMLSISDATGGRAEKHPLLVFDVPAAEVEALYTAEPVEVEGRDAYILVAADQEQVTEAYAAAGASA